MRKPPSPRSDLRRALAERRRQLPPADRLQAGATVALLLAPLPALAAAQHVAIYWSVSGELPLLAVTRELLARQKTLYLPIVQEDGGLRFGRWQPGDALVANRFGIPEPTPPQDALLAGTELDLVLVPLLGFDRQGQRLGSGGGYYDRCFAFLRGQDRPARPWLLGVGYAWQEQPALPAEAWDVALDGVVSDRELIVVHPVSAADRPRRPAR